MNELKVRTIQETVCGQHEWTKSTDNKRDIYTPISHSCLISRQVPLHSLITAWFHL